MYFNSRSAECKAPFGAVRAGQTVRFSVYDAAGPVTLELFADGASQPVLCAPLTPVGNGASASVTAPAAGLYFYRFAVPGGYLTRGEGGCAVLTESDGQPFQLTVYDAFETPDSFKGGVMYQIFPDSFCRSGLPKQDIPADRTMQPLDALPDNRPDENGRYCTRYYGGDLPGITEKLPYLASLGVTMLYLNPIFEAHANHRYNTANYLHIDPMLGTEADFTALCAAARRLGIAVILDGVFNHTGDDSLYFDKFGRYGHTGAWHNRQSPYRRWYSFHGTGYRGWWGMPTMPELNENEPSYRQFICGEGGVIDYWLDRGASGFRLDVADELPDGFIAACRTAVKRHPGCLLIGEVWEDASNKVAYSVRRRYLLGHELDGVMNYPFRTAILGFLRTGDAAAFAEAVTGILENYPAPVWPLLMNMLSTHDTERIITVLAAGRPPHSKQAQREYILPREEFLRGLELVKLAAALQFTLPGFPSVYYGDEIAMQGFGDPFCRAYYRWDDPPADLRGLMRSLSALRRSQPAFHTGGCRFLLAENGAVAYLREEKDSRVLVLVNRGEQTAELTIDGRCFRCQPWRTCIEVL